MGLAAGSAGRGAPDAVSSVEVTATDSSSVTIAWPASRDNDVVGYGVYVNGARVGTQTRDQVRRWRDRDSFSYTLQQLACGTGYTVGVDAFDRGDRHSPVTSTTVSTAACPDSTPPSVPSGMRQVAATENSVMLAWSASTDNVGVVEYGLYASGLRVATSSDASATLTNLACGTSYLVAIDAADAAGNRSTQATSYLRTSACPSSNKAPSTPTGLKVTAATATSVTLAWTRLHRRRRGHRLRALRRRQAHQRDDQHQRRLHGPAVRHHLRARRRRLRQHRQTLHRRRTVHRNLRPAHPRRHRRPPPQFDGRGEADDRQRRRPSRGSSTGVASTTATVTAARTTPARWSSSSTASSCSASS